jgi:hypothetical protein
VSSPEYTLYRGALLCSQWEASFTWAAANRHSGSSGELGQAACPAFTRYRNEGGVVHVGRCIRAIMTSWRHPAPSTIPHCLDDSLKDPVSQWSFVVREIMSAKPTALRSTQRALRSCIPCSTRKVKCDKAEPCATCVRRGESGLSIRETVLFRGEPKAYAWFWPIDYNRLVIQNADVLFGQLARGLR